MFRQVNGVHYQLVYRDTKQAAEEAVFRSGEGLQFIDLARSGHSYIDLRKKSLIVNGFLDNLNTVIPHEVEYYSFAYPPTEAEVASLRFVQRKYGINTEYAAEKAIERVVACLPQRGLMAHVAALDVDNNIHSKIELYGDLDERNIWYADNIEDTRYLAYEKEIGIAEASNRLYALSTVDETSAYINRRTEDFFSDKYSDFWIWLSSPGACTDCERLHFKVFTDDEIVWLTDPQAIYEDGDISFPLHLHCKCKVYPGNMDQTELLRIISENEMRKQLYAIQKAAKKSVFDDLPTDPLDVLQMLLDIVGFIPGLGEISDGINALISLARGDYLGAALSAASMIPFAGWASGAAKIVRGADKALDVAKHADEIYDAAKIASKADAIADATRIIDKADDALDVTKPYMKPGVRPKYGKGQVEAVWEKAKDADGRVFGGNGEELFWDKTKPRNGQWDMGHVEGKEYVDLHEMYRNGEMGYEDFIKEYRNIDNYRPESIYGNRSNNQLRRR